MALPATHVRYALELMLPSIERQKNAYLSGTLYPDSRMLTGISREQTHADTCLAESFATSPFRLGWQLHCRCDLIQAQVHTRLWPVAAQLPEPQRWIAMSAAKMVQDEADATTGPLIQHLDTLMPAEPPFGEPAETIARFYALIHEVYAARISPRERFTRLWTGVGLKPALIDKLMRAYDDLKSESVLSRRIAGSMPALLADQLPPAPYHRR